MTGTAEVIQLDAFRPKLAKTGVTFNLELRVSEKPPTEPAGLFPKRRSRASMQTFLFRSYDLIVKSDEADLIRDVCLDIHKAEVKLKKVRQRLQGIREQSAAQIQLLTAAETKLAATIIAARGQEQ